MSNSISMKPVKSRQIHSVGYDPATRTLAVRFNGAHGPGSLYHYDDVPPEVHAGFEKAESVGKYFGAHVKAAGFKFAKQPEKKEPAKHAHS